MLSASYMYISLCILCRCMSVYAEEQHICCACLRAAALQPQMGQEGMGQYRMGWVLGWGCPQFPPLQLCLFIPSFSRCSFLLGTPTMFIDILSQPDFDSYDLSTLRGGKSQNSNGKILRTRIFLVPCWEAMFLVL